MARRKKEPVTEYPVLTARQGKVLRFVVSRAPKQPVRLTDVVVQPVWSDLPQTVLQAKVTMRQLDNLGLVEQITAANPAVYAPTDLGIKLMVQADAAGLWKS